TPTVTKSADCTIADDATGCTGLSTGDMGALINLSGSHTLTIPAVSATIFANGMSTCYANISTGTWTLSSTPTINGLLSTSIGPSESGCLVGNGTSLDWSGFQHVFNGTINITGTLSGYKISVGTQTGTSCTLTGTGNAGCSNVNTGIGDCG